MATDTRGSAKELAGKLFLPVIVAAGSALGYLLTKKQNVRETAPKLREAVSDLPRPHVPEGGVGDIADELRGKVESVLGKESPASSAASSSTSIDRREFEQRRRARQERRQQRQQRARR
jgi:hypothetical protein